MINFEKTVKRFVKMHKELHGEIGYDKVAVCKDLLKEFGYPISDSNAEIIRQENRQFGLFLGRCQPYTKGHDEIVQDIIRDGKTPIIILGSINKQDEKNPLSFEERKSLIEMIYPKGVMIVGLEDQSDWTTWYESVKAKLVEIYVKKENLTLYSHCKAIDNKDFEYKGKHYKNESYTKMFEENGVKIKNVEEVVCSLGETIHASDVRNNESVAIRNLDARIYRKLKNKFGWWK